MPTEIQEKTINSGEADASGNASATIGPIRGQILAVHVNFSGSSASGTDTVVKTAGNLGASNTILSLTDTNTDGWYYPRAQVHDTSGTEVTYDGTNGVYEPIPVYDTITLDISQNAQGETVDVVLIVEVF